MEEEKLRKRVKKLAIIGLCLTFLFGGIAATVAYIFDYNYFTQRNKYDAITLGAEKKQVEAILGEGSLESEIPSRARLEGEYDEIYSYSITILGATSGSWVVIGYNHGRVVSKCAYGGDNETFFVEKRPKGKLQWLWEFRRSWLDWLIQLIVSGLLTYLCFIIARQGDFIIKGYKQTIIYFILLAELGVVIVACLFACGLSIALLLAAPFYL